MADVANDVGELLELIRWVKIEKHPIGADKVQKIWVTSTKGIAAEHLGVYM